MANLALSSPTEPIVELLLQPTVTTAWLEHVTLEEEQGSEDPRTESVSELKVTKQHFNKRFILR